MGYGFVMSCSYERLVRGRASSKELKLILCQLQ